MNGRCDSFGNGSVVTGMAWCDVEPPHPDTVRLFCPLQGLNPLRELTGFSSGLEIGLG